MAGVRAVHCVWGRNGGECCLGMWLIYRETRGASVEVSLSPVWRDELGIKVALMKSQ
jgi:hypothetical protein